MRGAYDYFLFTDPNSNTVINGGIGAGNGTNKFFTLGHNTGPSYFEAVGYVNQITNVKLNGVTVNPADYSISYPNVIVFDTAPGNGVAVRSEEHTSELQSLMRISYAVFCLKNNTTCNNKHPRT